jgi:hypothetical protein
MNCRSPKDTLSRHFEKFVVAGAVIVITAYAVSLAAGTSEGSQLSSQAQATVARVREAQEQAANPAGIQSNYLPELEQAFVNVPGAGAEPSWFAFKRPYALRRVEFVPQPKPLHFPPLLEVKSDVGQVELKWHDSEKNESVIVLGYELYRRAAGGAWQRIAELGPEENAYTDKGLEHDENYAYRLVSGAQPAPGAAQFESPQDARKESEPVTVRTRFNFDVKISSWSPGHASGKVVVFRPGSGEEEQPFSWRVGSPVRIDGKDTGWVVEEIEENSITIKKSTRQKTFRR